MTHSSHFTQQEDHGQSLIKFAHWCGFDDYHCMFSDSGIGDYISLKVAHLILQKAGPDCSRRFINVRNSPGFEVDGIFPSVFR